MEKITFQDGVTKGNAETFNQMQNNIENAINGFVLYENETGSNASITLSDSAANYKYLEMFFQSEGNYNSLKVHNPDGKNIYLQVDNVYSEDTYVKKSKWWISKASIAIGASFNYAITKGLEIKDYGNLSNIYITRVVGYK